jgi:hypothetical protein
MRAQPVVAATGDTNRLRLELADLDLIDLDAVAAPIARTVAAFGGTNVLVSVAGVIMAKPSLDCELNRPHHDHGRERPEHPQHGARRSTVASGGRSRRQRRVEQRDEADARAWLVRNEQGGSRVRHPGTRNGAGGSHGARVRHRAGRRRHADAQA